MKVCYVCGDRFNRLDWECPTCGFVPASIDGNFAFSPEMAAASEGYEAAFFAQLSTLEAKNFWFRSRNHLIIWALKRYFPQAQSFLEVGCGTGFVLSGIEQACSQLALFGSEVFATGLGFAAHRVSRATLFQMDARLIIPFVDKFDVVGAFDVLEHIQQDVEVLKQMHQAIQPGGGIVITVPQHPWLWSQLDDIGHHVRRYRAE
ncbi:MAG: class I SAM-dependent methyltransferase [Leptolyngbyaceae cyanobacterium CAN_BIN12]|nr:class I SAM-dependent methyltransferase [Leptolyngbyaceae cyanobacterium CAN_BIN12]